MGFFCLQEKYRISYCYLIPRFQFAIFNGDAIDEGAEVTLEVGQHYFVVVRLDHAVMWGDCGIFKADGVGWVAADGQLSTQGKFGIS